MPDIKVFLVDDHAVVRTGLATYLSTEPGMRVVGQASAGGRAIEEISALADTEELPEVVLMNVLMPEMDGITATSEIKQRWPEIEVVAVASGLGEDEIGAALRAGAAGYLLKDADDGDVADAIRAAQRGEVHLDAAAARSLTDALRGLHADAAALTPHERDVIVLIAGGGTNRQIAHHLGLSERTARTHVSSILVRLGLLSRTQAAMWAVREGLVSAHG